MIAGLDSSFFFILDSNEEAQMVWKERELITSAVVLYEIQKKVLKGGFAKWKTIVDDIRKAVDVIPLTPDAALKAGQINHGTGLHGFDSLILASLLDAGCTDIYTVDEHFAAYNKKGVTIHLLGKS